MSRAFLLCKDDEADLSVILREVEELRCSIDD